MLLTKYGSDPILVDVDDQRSAAAAKAKCSTACSSRTSDAGEADAVSMLAAAIAKSGDVPARAAIVARAVDAGGPAWQRAAMLQGLDTGLPSGGGGGRTWGRRSRRWSRRGRSGEDGLAAERADCARQAGGRPRTRPARPPSESSAKLDWPGKPAPVVEVAPLTPPEQKRYDAGSELYKSICSRLPPAGRQGKEKLAPSLVDSALREGARSDVADPNPARRQGRADRIDAAAWRGAERRADCVGADLHPTRVGSHRLAGRP